MPSRRIVTVNEAFGRFGGGTLSYTNSIYTIICGSQAVFFALKGQRILVSALSLRSVCAQGKAAMLTNIVALPWVQCTQNFLAAL